MPTVCFAVSALLLAALGEMLQPGLGFLALAAGLVLALIIWPIATVIADREEAHEERLRQQRDQFNAFCREHGIPPLPRL